jgi:hypothetical protein
MTAEVVVVRTCPRTAAAMHSSAIHSKKTKSHLERTDRRPRTESDDAGRVEMKDDIVM